MGLTLNPANWGIVNALQGQSNSSSNSSGGYTGPDGERGASPLSTTLNPISTNLQPIQAATTTSTDPYAKYGGTAAYNSLVQGFDAQKTGITNKANDAATNAGIGLGGSIADLIDSLKQGQTAIDSKATQNELSKIQGTQGVLGMVSRGVKSGGVTLANKNASDSSAADALARAYSDIGRQQLTGVGQQYEAGNRDVLTDQSNLDTQRAAGIRHIDETKEQTVNGIVADASNSLSALDAAIAGASLPQRIQIEQEKQNIKNNVLSQLQQYDSQLTNGVNSVQAMSPDQTRATAFQESQAGVAPENAFSYTSTVPAQFQDTGPFASSLPIFTFPRAGKTQG